MLELVGAFTDVATKGAMAGKTVWEELVERFKSGIDHTHQIMKDQTWVFKHASEVMKRFRFDYPELVATIICLPLPRCVGAEIGKCALLPAGLPNPACPRPTTAQLDTLFLPMSHSVIYLHHSTHAQALVDGVAKVKKHNLKAKAAQKNNLPKKGGNCQLRSIKPGGGARVETGLITDADETNEEMGFEPVDGNTPYVEHVGQVLDYILKIAASNTDIIQPFTEVIYALSLGSDCPLHFLVARNR